jgi:hypothetical protein
MDMSSTPIRGDVRCGKLPHFRGDGIQHANGIIDKKWPIVPGYTNINVCSNGTTYKQLSPMKLGPITIVEKKIITPFHPMGVHPGFQTLNETQQWTVATNLEAYWQTSKIYNIDVVNNIIQRSFYDRRAKFLADPQPHRRTIPKAKGYPVAAYFEGNILPYVASRIYYIKYYEFYASRRPEYQDLLRRVNNGENLHIIGFDGRDPVSGLADGINLITYEVLEREMYNSKAPFGHELILCGMLLNFNMERALKVKKVFFVLN